MPIQQYPKFKAVPDKMLDIPNPAMGGINLRDLEYEQEVNQSPYMLNVMYRNGAFGKRYGQEIHSTYADTIYSVVYFDGSIFVHAGKKIYRNTAGTITDVSGLIVFPESSGIFIVYAQKLYYLVSSGFYILDTTFKTIDAYIPDLFINCKPDGSHSDGVDEFNLMSDNFSLIYNGDSVSTTYTVEKYDPDELIDWNKTIVVYKDDVEVTQDSTNPPAANKCYIDKTNKQIIFGTAPADGDMNVKITFTLKDNTFSTERSQILSCKYYDTFGGANNSRLFIAGCGYSKYFYTASYDISYFPESNFATLGNTEEDITGFGRQYNVLIVFKPREVYSIYSYTETSSTTVIEENIGLEAFKSQLVNAQIGCDAPHSIQLVNNLLTWYNSSVGICTLTSTNIQDERNVRTISRNIDYTNNFGVKGILDYVEDLNTLQSIDFGNRYFLVFPASGMCFMWDYEIQPYVVTSRGETDPRKLCWFLFDHFYVTQFLKVGTTLLYASSHNDFNDSMIKLNERFEDLDFDGDTNADPINSYYMTPFMQFGAVEMLKNVNNLYVQCRGDVSSLINMYYYTNESAMGEPELDPISTGGKGSLWNNFKYGSFHWVINSWGNTLRRKCNLKKIQMASVYFENNELDKDMSVTHIGMQYQLVKYIK